MLTTNVSASAPDGVEPQAPADGTRRIEVEIAAEIARAFLTAPHPLEVCRFALARVTPLLGARFGSVYLRDDRDPTLLKLHCAYNWPQSSARYLGQLRIRESRGPTGSAVARDEIVEIPDVFGDASLDEWWEPARELGFVSVITMPLKTDRVAWAGVLVDGADGGVAGSATIGAVSLYFDSPRHFVEPERRLLGLVADQLAATVAKAQLMEELRQTNERLRASNEQLRRRVDEFEAARRLKDEFLANISHEFRTPLTSILGYGHLLSSGQLGDLNEKQGPAVSRIEGAGHSLLRLVMDLIDFAQLKLGQLRPVPQREDAVMLARRALDDAGAAPSAVRVAFEAEQTGIIVVTDGEKVVRVLTNLIRNAYKFTPEGSVTVSVARRAGDDGPAVEWAVRDTGIGIRAEDLELIFEAFRQADGSSTRLYGGAGLGLALCRGLATLLGGRVAVESQPGAGSTFTLRLPLAARPA